MGNTRFVMPTERRPADTLFAQAKRLAARLHKPIYIVDGRLSETKPSKPAATAWPGGTITTGNADAAARDIARKLTPPAA